MSMAFWLDIYQYLTDTFESLEILWNQHMAVIIKGKQTDVTKFSIECHGDYDINDVDMTHTIIYDNTLVYNEWHYITCQVDKFHKKIKINGNEEDCSPVEYAETLLTSSLTIIDNTEKFNYGFSFIRELKLFSSYNFDIWDSSHYNIKKEHFDFLLHYFKNDFSQLALTDAKIVDEVEGYVTKLNDKVKPKRIGYNYVIDYENLVICEEGYVYNPDTKRCEIFDSV